MGFSRLPGGGPLPRRVAASDEAPQNRRMGALEPVDVLTRHRLTVDDYYRMAETGVLAPDARVELIRGEIIDVAAMGTRHASAVMRLNRLLIHAAGSEAFVSVQTPLRLDTWSEPEPDLMLLRPEPGFYASRHPGAGDVLLLIEVAHSSARYDREIKLPLYAEHAVPEVWIVDLEAGLLRMHRHPRGNEYTETQALAAPERVAVPGLDGVALDLRPLF